MTNSVEINHHLRNLKFDLDYHREKQLERLVAHVKAGNPIGTFLGHHAEYSIDSTLTDIKSYLDALEEQKEQKMNRKKKFWNRLKK